MVFQMKYRTRIRYHTQKTPDHGRITNTVSIREHPAEAKARAVPGHWEGDLFFGSCNSKIATLVERKTRYLMLAKVAGKDTKTVVDALIKQAQKLPRELDKSLTWDRGSEMADHQRFSLGDGREGLLLRSAAALATRIEREHQRSAAAVLPEGDRSVGYSSGQAQCHRSSTERTAPTDTRLRDPGGTFGQCVASID
jgi:transposase, IS30 family